MLHRSFIDGNPWHILSARVFAVGLLPLFVLFLQGVPSITRQPPETLVDELGTISTLSVEATGEATLRYQWFRYVPPGPHDWRDDYIPLTGQTNASYTPRNFLWRQFVVAIYDQTGSVTSRVSTISVPQRFAFQRVSSWPPLGANLVNEFRDFVHKDQTILAATRTNALELLDVSDPSSPRLIGQFPNPGRAIAIERRGNIAAVASASAGIDLLDITDPRAPVRLSTAQFGVNVREVVMVEGRVYGIAASSQDIYPTDISNPAEPRIYPGYRIPSPISGMQDTPRNPQAIVAQGTKIFINSVDGNIRILDAANPTNILQVGVYDSSGAGYLSGATDHFLFASVYGRGHLILDISRPEAPVPFSSFSSSSGGKIEGDLLISGVDEGIQIHDVSTPVQPAPIGWFYAPRPEGYFGPPISTTHATIAGNNLFSIEAGARLVVYAHLTNAPVIVAQPEDLKIYASEQFDSAPLIDTMRVMGALPLAYQWYHGESGDTNRPVDYQTLPWLSAFDLPEGGGAVQKLWVRVRNHIGFADSRTVTISWIPQLRVLESGQLRLIAGPSSSWILQSSSDLRTWTNESTVTVSGGRAIGMADVAPPPAQPSSEARFFRLVDKPAS